jgi:transcription initiation factor TFIIB
VVESISHEKITMELNEIEKCDNCGGQLIKDIERGQYVCKDCGTVMNYPMLSTECESNFSGLVHGGECYVMGIYESGPPTTLAFHDLGISTEIASGFRDGKGKLLHGKARYRAIILRKWHSRTRTKDANDLSIAKALSILNDLADRLNLPAYVREEASAIYRKVADKGLTKGRSKASLVAVCVYAAIRRAKLPQMLRDVLPTMGMSMSEFNLYLNAIKRGAGVEVPSPDPAAWIPKIANECHFSPRSQILATNYIRSIVREGEAFGMLPHVVAAIALYRMGILNGEQKNVYEVAKTAKCAPASILKGLISDSTALRNGGKIASSEFESASLGERKVGDGYMQKGREGALDNCPTLLYSPDLDNRVRA